MKLIVFGFETKLYDENRTVRQIEHAISEMKVTQARRARAEASVAIDQQHVVWSADVTVIIARAIRCRLQWTSWCNSIDLIIYDKSQ